MKMKSSPCLNPNHDYQRDPILFKRVVRRLRLGPMVRVFCKECAGYRDVFGGAWLRHAELSIAKATA